MKPIQFSFAGGEISKELWSRLDIDKYQIGAEYIENFVILPHGPLRNRPGWEFCGWGSEQGVGPGDHRSRLVEMRSARDGESSHVLEFSPTGVYVYRDGQVIVDAQADVTSMLAGPSTRIFAAGHTITENDRIIIDLPHYKLANRHCTVRSVVPGVSFIVCDMAGSDIDTTGALDSGIGTVYRVMRLNCTNLDYSKADFAQKNDVLTVTAPLLSPVEYRRSSDTSWVSVPITFGPSIATPAAPSISVGGPGGGSAVTYFYRVTAIKADTLEESLPSPAVSASRDLTIAGNFIKIVPAAVAGAIRYNVYKLMNGLYGFIAQSEGDSVQDRNITPDFTKTIPIAANPFAGGAESYPTVSTYFQGRRVFGNSANFPQNFWLTRSATDNNMSYSIPSQADDAIAGSLSGNTVQSINNILQLGALVYITSGGVWRMASDNEVVTPSNAFPVQQSEEGGSRVPCVTTEGCILYVSADGERVNKAQYSWQQNSIVVENVSALAPHLFAGYQLTDMTWRMGTDKAAYIVRNDGVVLGFTFSPAAEVLAWCRHTTQGEVLAMCSSLDWLPRTREGNTEGDLVLTPTVYALIKRANGNFVERISRWDYGHFVDSFILPRNYSAPIQSPPPPPET